MCCCSSNAFLSNGGHCGQRLVDLSSHLPLLSDPCGTRSGPKWVRLARLDHHHHHDIWWHPKHRKIYLTLHSGRGSSLLSSDTSPALSQSGTRRRFSSHNQVAGRQFVDSVSHKSIQKECRESGNYRLGSTCCGGGAWQLRNSKCRTCSAHVQRRALLVANARPCYGGTLGLYSPLPAPFLTVSWLVQRSPSLLEFQPDQAKDI